MTTDQLGRGWTRTAVDTMTCEDGTALIVGVDWTDEQAAQAVSECVWQQQRALIPESVDMAQARLALLGAGLLSSVDDAIAAMPEPERSAAQIEWEFRATVRRDSSLVAYLSTAIGLTGEQVDALFVSACRM